MDLSVVIAGARGCSFINTLKLARQLHEQQPPCRCDEDIKLGSRQNESTVSDPSYVYTGYIVITARRG
ncbi:hypothetical protein DFH06DRAFT_1341463 [Mycena polygramma]|nr:hypothetical protein DFH06DRAFT_1348879 [Mycena polygramma]KAJ7610596.1 hypothetical protein DFH06DRAFT_1345999 [Mycena polygramma]KAJ7610604.1 hypothetical protein DFH06DRAFT_1346008 [Mycena polygramma]KAJ7620773.1 hypothetical protein DFH06DRAFT_1341463 [Mycena polygramma]